MEAHHHLMDEGIFSTVVSMPCIEKFEEQSQEYRDIVIKPNKPVVIVEAAIEQSWGKYLGKDSIFIGMKNFGSSAPGDVLYEHFGITKKNV